MATVARIIPVIDVMGGQVVRAVGGRRSEYRPIVSKLTDSTEPVEVAKALLGATGVGEIYLADLDRSLFIVTPGQSGNPISRHARDFLTRWRDGAMVLLGPIPASISGHIRLVP